MVSNQDINSMRSSNHFLCRGGNTILYIVYTGLKTMYIYIYCMYIYYIYVYPQHDRSLTAPSYREKCCHFPPVSELLEGWVQHFCCYTLALQRILVVWKKQPKNTHVGLEFFGCFFFSIFNGGGLVGGTKVGRCLFGWALCACIKREDPYESTRILWDVQVRQLVAGG